MPYGIETVTVIGAGTMGAAIAGHLANAGIHAPGCWTSSRRN
jgi:3-hydroxyacyl-CoA dehydrogenase